MIHTTASVVLASGGGAATPSAFLLYVVYPTIVVGIGAMGSYVRTVIRRLTVQDKALALLLAQVAPEGQPTLRDVVNANAETLGLVKQRQTDRWEYVQEELARLRGSAHPPMPPSG